MKQPLISQIPLPLRLALFYALERVSGWRTSRQASPVGDRNPDAKSSAADSLWVFASTIGEVHAIEPFLDRLRQELGDPPLTLISDRSIYRDAYRTKYPHAQIEQLDGSTAQVASLLARHPPRMLLVAEIPALLHDAPCRLSFLTQQAARSARVPIVLVNGWLYGYAPPSRLDWIENHLFAYDYAAGFDLALVQTEAVRNGLVAAGADPDSVHVTGNIKFDAMLSDTARARPSALQSALAENGQGPLVVAGSITEIQHQREVVDAFVHLRRSQPDARLVLAPRHPENAPRMAALREMLGTIDLSVRYRSQTTALEAARCDLLVLDTMGELRGCYAVADVAFVGVDHNVLEPLTFGKPTFVGDGWEPTYPSYPVYRQMLEAAAVVSVGALDQLGEAWATHFEGNWKLSAAAKNHVNAVIAAASGAAARNIEAMRKAGLLTTRSTAAQ